MKYKVIVILVSCVLSISTVLAQGGYSGAIKPAIVAQTPSFETYFKATSIDKLTKTKSMVISQFNVNIAEEEYIDLRSGGTKANMNNAMVNLQFKIVNLDKNLIQAATDELFQYLQEKLRGQGFTVKDYESFKAHKSYQKLSTNEGFNGSPVKEIDAGSRPGFADVAMSKFIGFSALNMPSINISGMKGAKLPVMGSDLEADVLGFGLSIHFIEWEGVSMSTGKVEVKHKPQIFFGTTNMTIFPYKKIGFVTIIDQKPYGYTFGREFVMDIKEGANEAVINNATYKTYELIIDNEKLKNAIVELGKSYIDVMVMALSKQ